MVYCHLLSITNNIMLAHEYRKVGPFSIDKELSRSSFQIHHFEITFLLRPPLKDLIITFKRRLTIQYKKTAKCLKHI